MKKEKEHRTKKSLFFMILKWIEWKGNSYHGLFNDDREIEDEQETNDDQESPSRLDLLLNETKCVVVDYGNDWRKKT